VGSEVKTGTNVGRICLVDAYLLLLLCLWVSEKEKRMDVAKVEERWLRDESWSRWEKNSGSGGSSARS
jgi:hypothetical protein